MRRAVESSAVQPEVSSRGSTCHRAAERTLNSQAQSAYSEGHEGSRHRHRRHQSQGGLFGAADSSQDPLGFPLHCRDDGSRCSGRNGRLGLRLRLHRISRPDHRRCATVRSTQPGAGLGALRLRTGLREAAALFQRCGHAGVGWLSGWSHALSRNRHRAGRGVDLRRRGCSSGAGSSALSQGADV